jgi:site-specific DNA-methyltransferase (adenine-specific)
MCEIEGSMYVSEDSATLMMRIVSYARSQRGTAIHPSRKPGAIIEPLLRNTCPIGGLVLQSFAGSGTTGFIANPIGLARHFDWSKRRLSNCHANRFAGNLLTTE